MRSPLRKYGTIKFEVATGTGLDEVVKSVEEALHRASAAPLRVTPNTITFRGGYLRPVTNWNVLLPISSGEIHFDRSGSTITIDYGVSWISQFVIVAAILSALVAVSGDRMLFFILPIGWLFMLVLTYTELSTRFPRFLAYAAGAPIRSVRLGDAFPDY